MLIIHLCAGNSESESLTDSAITEATFTASTTDTSILEALNSSQNGDTGLSSAESFSTDPSPLAEDPNALSQNTDTITAEGEFQIIRMFKNLALYRSMKIFILCLAYT